MPQPDAAQTIRAAAEAFVPGLELDATAGAADVDAERFITHYLDLLSPDAANAVAAVLDSAAAAAFDGARFLALPVESRTAVLESLADDDAQSSRDVAGLLGLLAVAAVYGEWTGLDEDGSLRHVPLGWDLTGFDGPVRSRPRLLRDGP